jgi:hypothetical protein
MGGCGWTGTDEGQNGKQGEMKNLSAANQESVRETVAAASS